MMLIENRNEFNTFFILLYNRRVKQAGFIVLKKSKMPSVLLELRYMTNKKDIKLLKNQLFQDKLEELIAKLIMEYEKDKYDGNKFFNRTKILLGESNFKKNFRYKNIDFRFR